MRLFIAPIVIGVLTLAGASPGAAQSKPSSGQARRSECPRPAMRPPKERATRNRPRTRSAFGSEKLHDFDAKDQVKATDAKTSASKDIDDAWAQTKTAFAGLEAAGEKDWDSAKASYKTASDKLAVTWKRVNPADK